MRSIYSHILIACLAGAPLPLAAQPATRPPPAEEITPLDPGARIEDERNTIAISRNAAASAVFVTQQQVVIDYYGGQALEVPAGSGSGFVWDAKGHIVTNYHVVKGAKRLTVTLHDQRTLQAEVIGAEPRKDIAVLRVDAGGEPLTPIRQPKEKLQIEVGQKVVAIGNPFGLDHTVTTGIVSAIGREVESETGGTMRDMIQTDAAINPGNSGGPLLDSSGRLIGMNTAIYSRSGAWAGIGFAVPVDTIQRIVPQLIKYGRVRSVGLGVQIDPQQRVERRLRLRGVAVLDVIPNSPAAKAGLQGIRRTRRGLALGDVIVAIDGKAIEDYDDLYNALDTHQPGDKVTVRVAREDKVFERQMPVVLLE